MVRLFFYFVKLFFGREIKHLLIVFQNNNEIRAGGGFITQVLDVEIGKFRVKFKFHDVFNDLKSKIQIEPPKEVKAMLGLDNLEFRDANIDPDFEKSAKTLISIYQSVFPENKVPFLMAVNFSFIEKIWPILRSKNSPKNLFYYLSLKVSDIDLHDRKQYLERKNVLKKLFKSLIKNFSLKFWKWPKVSRVMKKSMSERNIQIWRDDKKFKKEFDFEGFDNFLAVIDCNYLGSKTNRYLRRNITHDIYLKEGEESVYINYLKIELGNFGSLDFPISGVYQSDLRVYLPKKVFKIDFANPNLKYLVEEKGEFKILHIPIQIPPKRKIIIALKYLLNVDEFFEGKISYKYFKQSGVENENFMQAFSVPENYSIKNMSDDSSISENVNFRNFSDLKNDIIYNLEVEKFEKPPRVYYQEIISPNIIEIRFNEPVKFLEEGEGNVVVEDIDGEKSYSVEKYEFIDDDCRLFIFMKDLPEVDEKFYKVRLSNLENFKGVKPEKDPKVLTVVYRSGKFI